MTDSCYQSLNLLSCLLFPVARGSVKKVEKEEEHSSITVEISRLYRQKTQIFASGGVRVRKWTGHIKMPLQCGVKSGEGDFLFTGTVRFGEAWMGCAPRYKDFLRLYHAAQQRGANPCHVDTDWAIYLPALGQVLNVWGRKLNSVYAEERKDWETGPVAEPRSFPAALWLCENKERSSWMLPSSTIAGLFFSENVFQLPFSFANEELAGFKCSKLHLVFMCIKCEWTLYILKLCMLCKKLDVQFWSYFLLQKCKKVKANYFLFCLKNDLQCNAWIHVLFRLYSCKKQTKNSKIFFFFFCPWE